MVVDINKIKVKDRIRKDYGNIEELAEDIKKNGIINPPVINKDYVLIAGERRLKALRLLGNETVEVRMMDTRDDEHELKVEVSENEIRKDFSMAERMDFAKRLMEVEAKKAKERQEATQFGSTVSLKSDTPGRADELVASQLGMRRDTLRKALTVADNASLLTPSDFADWDEGRLSTNKAYNKIREERDKLRRENEEAKGQIEEFQDELEEAQKRIDGKNRNYEALKRDYDKQVARNIEMKEELKSIKDASGEAQYNKKRLDSALFFCASVADFIERVGGYTWLTDELDNLPDSERRGYIIAIDNLREMVDRFDIKVQKIIN